MNRPANQLNWNNYRGISNRWQGQVASASLPDDEGVQWADYAKSIMAGGAGLVESVGWLATTLGSEDIGPAIQDLGSDSVDYWHDSLSDPAKAELAKQLVRKNDQGEYEWGDASFSTVGLMGAESLLGTAAGMGAGAGITKVLQTFANPFGRGVLSNTLKEAGARLGFKGDDVVSQIQRIAKIAPSKLTALELQAAKKLKLVDGVLGATGFGAGEGAVGGISAGSSVYEQIMSLTPEKLLQNDRYKEIFESTDQSMSELERHQYAADTVAKEASLAAGWQSGLTTALLGAPMGAYFGRILGGAKLSSTLTRGIATGAAGEAAQEFAQSGVEQIISNINRQPFEPDLDTFEGALEAAVAGAAAGGLLGGAVGPFSVKGSRQELADETEGKRRSEVERIGGEVTVAAKAAANAGASPKALANIVHDWANGTLDEETAKAHIEALTEEARGGPDATNPGPPPPPGPGTAEAEEAEPVVPSPEEAAETLERVSGEPVVVEQVDPTTLQVDAARFQFKASTDSQGVSKALKGVKTFEAHKAGLAIVYEQADGQRFIVDGHQRVGLAKRAVAAGQPKSQVSMAAFIVREADGVTEEMATNMAALKNIAEGTGSPVDAAKVMREMGPAADEAIANLPPNSALVQHGKGLAKLDEAAFELAVNEVVDPRYAAAVGDMVAEPELQTAAIEVLRQTEPANTVQARAIIDQVRTAGTTEETTEDLFGEQTVTESLYLERAKVLDAALRSARRDKATFKTLTDKESTITGAGENVLDRAANEAKISEADRALTALSTVANTKGPVSDALTKAAQRVKAGEKPGAVAAEFLSTALPAIQRGGKDGAKAGKRKQAATQKKRKQGGPRKVGHQITGLSPEAQAAAAVRLDTQLQGEGLDILPGGAVAVPTADALFSRKSKKVATGHCFENTGRHMMHEPADTDLTLVHGYMIGSGPIEGVRFAHSWLERTEEVEVEINGETKTVIERTAIDMTTDDRVETPLEMPAQLYEYFGQAEVMARYTKDEAVDKMAETGHFGPWDFKEDPEAAEITRGEGKKPAGELYSRARLQNRPLGGSALAELEREVINPIQTDQLSPEDDPGAALLTSAIDIKEGTITLPEENRASLAAMADTLDRVISGLRAFRYNDGWRAQYANQRYQETYGKQPGRRTYEEMSNAINSLQNLAKATREASVRPPVSAEIQGDMFGAPAAPEVETPPTQEALFSRTGIPLGEIRLMREFEVEETGEVVQIEQNAEVLLRQLDKRVSVVEKLRACVGG